MGLWWWLALCDPLWHETLMILHDFGLRRGEIGSLQKWDVSLLSICPKLRSPCGARSGVDPCTPELRWTAYLNISTIYVGTCKCAMSLHKIDLSLSLSLYLAPSLPASLWLYLGISLHSVEEWTRHENTIQSIVYLWPDFRLCNYCYEIISGWIIANR